jgi:hypothetical protein
MTLRLGISYDNGRQHSPLDVCPSGWRRAGSDFFPDPAAAWGDEGHKVICEIAFRMAKPSTRAEIQRLIKTDTAFNRFSDSCIWPDHPRKRSAEHFVNLARDSRGLKDEACPRAQECVLSAEPPRVFRRLFRLSHAAMAVWSSMA